MAVLDPRGTGDSCGEHGDATWAGWREDVASPGAGSQPGRLTLQFYGASGWVDCLPWTRWQRRDRAGCAAALAARASGKQWFSQFLRLATAQQITGTGGAGPMPRACGPCSPLGGRSKSPATIFIRNS